MHITRVNRFKKDYQKLDNKIKDAVDRKLRQLLGDKNHPSLRFKRVRKQAKLWELSVTKNYRILLLVEADEYVLYRVGAHDILNSV